MGHGGRRPGAGRPLGSLNRRSQEKAAELEASGLLPLDFLISVMRDDVRPIEIRLEAALDDPEELDELEEDESLDDDDEDDV